MEPEPLPPNPTTSKNLASAEDIVEKEKEITKTTKSSKKKLLPTPPLPSRSSKPARAAKTKANAKFAAQNAAYQSALKEKESADKIVSLINAKKTTNQKKKCRSLKDNFANDNDQKEVRGEGDDNQNSLLDQADESFDVDDEDVLEDAAKVPSLEGGRGGRHFVRQEEDKRESDRQYQHQRKDAKCNFEGSKNRTPRKREKSTVRVAPLTKETSRGKKTALEQSTAKKKDGWREKMNDLTNILHVEDEKNIDDAQLGKSDKSEKETLRYDIAKIERRLKFSTGKKPDDASTLKRKNRGDVDKTDDFAYREDNEDDDLLFLSSQNESDEREKKRAATATKVLGFKNNDDKDFGMEEEEDEDDNLPTVSAAENQFDAIKNAMETLRCTKTREAESKVQKLTKNLEMDFEKHRANSHDKF